MAPTRKLNQVVVVGGGVAGAMAVHTLRTQGYDGDLTMVGDEWHAPYHRPALSKKLLTGEVHRAGIDMAPQNTLDLRVLRGARAVGVDTRSCTVEIRDDGRYRTLDYDGLVLASGAVARQWPKGPVPDGVLTLRTVEDCFALRSRIGRRTRVVVVGGGFIGTEVAASLNSMGVKVTLVSRGNALLQTALGAQIGSHWTDLHRQHGVDVRLGVEVDAFLGGGHVKSVRLSDGSKVRADLVLVGLGAEPVTEWLRGSDIPVDNGIVCDARGFAQGSSVVAAGDVACWWHPLYQRHLRTEHWEQASRQGITAARNLLLGPDGAEELDAVPYFWSDQYDTKLQLLGVPEGYDTVEVIEGGAGDGDFTAAYGKDGKTIAVLSTTPARVNDFRDALAEAAAFPPARTAALV